MTLKTNIDRPYFSVIIPNYKNEPFIEQCLDSVKSQTFSDFECILLDDGSPGVEVILEGEKNSTTSDYWHRSEYKNQFIPKKNLPGEQQSEYIFDKLVITYGK